MGEHIEYTISYEHAPWRTGTYRINVVPVDGGYSVIPGKAVVTVEDVEDVTYEDANGTITTTKTRTDDRDIYTECDDRGCCYTVTESGTTTSVTVRESHNKIYAAWPIPCDCERVPKPYNECAEPDSFRYGASCGVKFDVACVSGDNYVEAGNVIYYDPENPPDDIQVSTRREGVGRKLITGTQTVDYETTYSPAECGNAGYEGCCDSIVAVRRYTLELQTNPGQSNLPGITLYIRKRLRTVHVKCRTLATTGEELDHECHAYARRGYTITRLDNGCDPEAEPRYETLSPETAYGDPCGEESITAEWGSGDIELGTWYGWDCASPDNPHGCIDKLDYVAFDGWYVTSPLSCASGSAEQRYRFSTERKTTITLQEEWCRSQTEIHIEAVYRVSQVKGVLRDSNGKILTRRVETGGDPIYYIMHFDSTRRHGCGCPDRPALT